MPHRTYSVQEAAAELQIGPRRLYQWLRTQRVLDAGNRPYQQFIDQGLLHQRQSHWNHPITGAVHYHARPVITQRGLVWLRNRIRETEHA